MIDYLYISHGHEDHLHLETLAKLRPGGIGMVPRFVTGRLAPFLRDLGTFSEVIELDHGRPVTLRNGFRATCYVNVTDSILVLEGDETVVNANDALHASPAAVIDHFCRVLQRRHPHISAMFIGYGGAAWSPNCVRVPGNDERAIARAQEAIFVRNFLHIVDRLKPKVACAFAASFILLEPWNRWINDINKLDVTTPDVEYALRNPNGWTQCHLLLPNDVIEGMQITRGDTARPSREGLERAYATIFREDSRRAIDLVPLKPDELTELAAQMEHRLQANRDRIGRGVSADVEFVIRDNPGTAIRVAVRGRCIAVTVGRESGGTPAVALRAEILRAVLNQDYGTESVFIGYGAVASLAARAQLGTVQTLIQPLSARLSGPRAILKALRESPGATVGDLWRQRVPLGLQMALRIRLISNPSLAQTVGASVGPRAR